MAKNNNTIKEARKAYDTASSKLHTMMMLWEEVRYGYIIGEPLNETLVERKNRLARIQYRRRKADKAYDAYSEAQDAASVAYMALVEARKS